MDIFFGKFYFVKMKWLVEKGKKREVVKFDRNLGFWMYCLLLLIFYKKIRKKVIEGI